MNLKPVESVGTPLVEDHYNEDMDMNEKGTKEGNVYMVGFLSGVLVGLIALEIWLSPVARLLGIEK